MEKTSAWEALVKFAKEREKGIKALPVVAGTIGGAALGGPIGGLASLARSGQNPELASRLVSLMQSLERPSANPASVMGRHQTIQRMNQELAERAVKALGKGALVGGGLLGGGLLAHQLLKNRD